MLRPIIMIGCGGSGQKSVRYVRDAVRRRLEHAGWENDFPKAWQFIGIDTLNIQEDQSIPFLPNSDYVSLALKFGSYLDLNGALEARFGPFGTKPEAFHDLIGWRPNPMEVKVPLKDGAGQLRAVGRAAGVLAIQENVRDRVIHAFSQCSAGGPELVEVSQRLGVDVPPGTPFPEPLVLVVGSMAGGTGAGVMLDIIDLIRRSHKGGDFPVLVAFTPDIFGDLLTDGMSANSAAFMSELLSAYWDNEGSDSRLIPADVPVNNRGPHSIFVIGRKNIDGLDLGNSKNVYRAVGEALAAVVTSHQVQTKFHHFITVNWATFAPRNAGGYGFGNGLDSLTNGVASSFGSATISVGHDRFREYLQKLLHRSIIEQLAFGFESVALSTLGDAAKTLSMPGKVAELARRNRDKFVVDCGLSVDQVVNEFISNDVMKAQHGEVSKLIKAPFQTAQQQAAQTWQSQIFNQAQQSKVTAKQSANDVVSDKLKIWSTETYRKVLRTTNEFSISLSIPVVLSLIEMSRADILNVAGQLREKAKEDRLQGATADTKARGCLTNLKGNVSLSAGPVQETITEVSKSIVFEWAAEVREHLAVTLESLTSSMLSSIESGLKQANGRIHMLVTPQNGNPAIIAGWPTNSNVVPEGFAPSPVEFYLEDYANWPQRAKELINRSLGDKKGLPLDPIDAACALIIRGGFSGSNNSKPLPPFVWGEGHGDEPEWEAGSQVAVKVGDSNESLSERIDGWLRRPATDLSRVLAEGLGAYLETNDPKSKEPIADHHERLQVFKKQLQRALMQSRPLVEINLALNAIVHQKNVEYDLNIQGFPFGVGHPARQITEETIKGFLNTATDVGWAFSGTESESVLLSNFLKYPVHPSVLTSFTQPFAAALNNFDSSLLQSSFWQWRRARILENFIPLPDELRRAAIRGFAISRALGVMTANVDEQNFISVADGKKAFPKKLLTMTNTNNLLPALLEAMILTFADATTMGARAFDAYGALIKYGMGESTVGKYEITGVLKSFIETGNYGTVEILDENRAAAVRHDSSADRVTAIGKYLQANIERFERIALTPLDPKSWRDQSGKVDPVDTLTRELLSDLTMSYVLVRDAVTAAAAGDDGFVC